MKFWAAWNFFKYGLVFKEESGHVFIKPLQGLPGGNATWSTLITFDPLQLYDACGVSMSDAFTMRESCRYGVGSLKALESMSGWVEKYASTELY